MKKRIISLLLASVLALSPAYGMTAKADTCGGLEAKDVYQPSAEEVIRDPILHWAVRAAMNSIQSGVKLTAEMVGDKSVKNISYELCAHPEDFETEEWAGKQYWIENLEGLQYAKSATMIDIAYTSAVEGKSLKDLSPLSGLTQLDQLILKQDGITDISDLSKLTNLTLLDISANQKITDISAIKDMKKLTSLSAQYNQIESVDALSELENLKYVSISNNKVKTLPDCSELTQVYFLDASHNELTDVTEIGKMRNLEELNLAGNTNVTDITPLARLTKLEKEKTTLPDNSKKDDLFAAIEVNKLFAFFNISKMTESDLPQVQAALDAYEKLTDEQKTYFDEKRIEAAYENKKKVEYGEEPIYYPEYDEDGVKTPIFDRLEIQVIDQKGIPLPDVEFQKIMKNEAAENVAVVKTNSTGKLVLKHSSTDAIWNEITIVPAGDVYIATPEKLVYSVAWGNTTDTINGIAATGLEELTFVLVAKNEYVEKTVLAQALEEAEKVEEAYKYTKETYAVYESALKTAKDCYESTEVTKEAVDAAAEELKEAITALQKTEILTELKLIVKDQNGNVFHRPFKFQVRVPETGAEAWNETSNAYTGIAYLKAAPGWEEGKTWEILACHEEPYEFEPILVTIGVKDGQRYYRTVDGVTVDVDYEKEIIVKPRTGNVSDATRTPDATVLQEAVAQANEVDTNGYTPESVETFTQALERANNILNQSEATQEEYNQAIADLQKAQSTLKKTANKTALTKEIKLKESYLEDAYTTETWVVYQETLAKAEAIVADGNATQEAVDQILQELKEARNTLVRKADKTKLEEALTQAKGLKEDDYTSGYEALQKAIQTADKVYVDEKATQAEVDVQVEALQKAIKDLVKKPIEPSYACDPGVFRAKVLDTKGNPVKGVTFECVIDGVANTEKIVSDEYGIITYYVYGPNRGKTTSIKLADQKYTTEDEHSFQAEGPNEWIVSMTTIDGTPYEDGRKLTYVVKKKEADGMRVLEIPLKLQNGTDAPYNIKFTRYDVKYMVEHNLYSDTGKLVWKLGAYEKGDYELYLPEDSKYIASPEFIKVHVGSEDGIPVIETVNGKPVAEALPQITLWEKGTNTCDLVTFRAIVRDKNGNPLEGIRFHVENGDPSELITDENGILEYQVTSWDTDQTMTVTLAENQGWKSYGKGMQFTVVDDPNDEGRGILDKVNGSTFSGDSPVYYTIFKPEEEPVSLKAPTSVKATLSGGYDDVKVSWSKVSGASSYRVYYKKATSTKYTRLTTTTKLYATKKNLTDGVKYIFKVVPCYTYEEEMMESSSSKTAAVYTLKKLSAPKVTKVNSKKVKVSWTNIYGESGYQISRSTKKNGTNIVSTYATTAGKTKTLTVTKGKKYYYKVRAYKTVDGKKIYGPWSSVKTYTLK